METAKTIYLGNLRTEATHVRSGQKIVTDAPVDNQGKGEFFSPTDLLATALASCMLTIMGIAARTHGFDIDGTEVKITKVMGVNPRRVVEVIVELNFPRNYSVKEKRIIELSAKECPVANSLHPDLKQTVVFNYKGE
ncbi:OsmC family protein [Acetobacteroides hydrogenigenes]|uniref:Putative OsmC-like protein n=1 Tax=Acetobacteroides hydrogenigenes TaxID=979970 RepID=A0A4R2EUV7_9BACT|nr:OsmC family protein [Acetobacteroides hydrogenigenes]TCN72914.1 putative OsmC-like protein [Acetobacteroides hydrogenigenes]